MTDKNDNIRSIPTAIDKLAGDVEAMKRSLPAYLEYVEVKAQIQRTHYLALLKQGFSVEEALYITAKGEIEE